MAIKTEVLTTQQKKRKHLKAEAAKVILKLKQTNLKQDYIAEQMDVQPATLSRFMTEKDSYITQSMVDKAKAFIESLKIN